MRRRVRNAYRLKAFFDGRVHELRAGRSVDPFVDLGRLRVVVAFLVDSGVVRRSDWESLRHGLVPYREAEPAIVPFRMVTWAPKWDPTVIDPSSVLDVP